MIEYIQRKRGREQARARLRHEHGNKYGEVLLLDKVAFIFHDIDKEEKEISKANIAEDGKLENIEKSSLEEMEKTLYIQEKP